MKNQGYEIKLERGERGSVWIVTKDGEPVAWLRDRASAIEYLLTLLNVQNDSGENS